MVTSILTNDLENKIIIFNGFIDRWKIVYHKRMLESFMKIKKLVLRVPLVNDYLRLYPKTFQFKDTLSRKSFWKSMSGFLVLYFVLAFVCNFSYLWIVPNSLTWFPSLKSHMEIVKDVWVTLHYIPLGFILISAFPIFGAFARRLNDAGFSPWWFLIIALPFGFIPLFVMSFFPEYKKKDPAKETVNKH